MNVWLGGWMDECMDGCMNGWRRNIDENPVDEVMMSD